jgi:hypothetical protein
LPTTNKILSVKIPVALAEYAIAMRKKKHVYETNTYIKNIAAYLILKAETPYSILRNYKTQIDHLAFITQCERQTFRKRVSWMLQEGLAKIVGNDLQLVSYKDACAIYFCSYKATNTILYEPGTDKNFYLRLFTTEINANKERQRYSIEVKLKRNPTLKQTIQVAMLQHGADRTRIDNFQYLHNGMKKLYRHSFQVEPSLHAMLHQVRPDCNRGVKGISLAWQFKSASLVSYYKRKFEAAGVAVIHKGERIESRTRCRNSDCKVIWNNSKKQTVLCLVDAIEVTEKIAAA